MRITRKTICLAVVCGGMPIVFIGCTRDQHPTEPASRAGPAIATPSLPSSVAKTQLVGNDRSRRALAKSAWVGRVHNEAMRDVFQNRAQWVGSDQRDAARICEGIAKLVIKYSPQINAHAGISRSGSEDRQAAVTAVENQSSRYELKCNLPLTMNIFRGSAGLFSLAPDTSGYQPYLNNLVGALDASDGSPATAQAIGQGILNSANGLDNANYEVVATAVSLADSSTQVWADYASANGCAASQCGSMVKQMSLFAMPTWLKGVIIDVLGCAAGALKGGGVIGCVAWGIASSAMYFVALM